MDGRRKNLRNFRAWVIKRLGDREDGVKIADGCVATLGLDPDATGDWDSILQGALAEKETPKCEAGCR